MESEALPADMLFEILSRASFETIQRCKVVSKGLRQIIYDATFLPLHCKRTNAIFGYYFQTTKDCKYKSAFVSADNHHSAAAAINDMQILASCDHGILCCEKRICKSIRYYTYKPATNQWQPLPNPKLRDQTVAVAIVVVKTRPLRYNIVRLSRSRVNYNCEIFDSENWAWEKTQGPNLPYHVLITPHKAAVCVGQYVHWLTSDDDVLAFDVNERSFRCFLLPEPVHRKDGYERKQLVKYEDGLGFTCMAEDKKRMEVWVAEERRRCMWTNKMVVNTKLLEETLTCPVVVDFCSTDVAFLTTADGAAFCNFRDGCFSRVEVPYNLIRDAQQIFRFRSDLESVDLKRV